MPLHLRGATKEGYQAGIALARKLHRRAVHRQAGDGNFELVAPAIGAVVGDQHIIFGHRFRTWKTSLEKFALLDEGFALPYPLHQVQRFELARRQARDILIAMEDRSEEHTSELQSLMLISYAVFCL